jgi:hypothetical protein
MILIDRTNNNNNYNNPLLHPPARQLAPASAQPAHGTETTGDAPPHLPAVLG